VPAAIIWWLEWWSFEGLTVMVGLLPDAKVTLAAHGIIFNTVVTLYQVFQGVGTALCAVVGQRVGAGKSGEVPWLCVVGALGAAVGAAILSSGLYFGQW
jgi:MATE family multidrug resistance protein